MTAAKNMSAQALVAHLHPADQPSRQHTLAAVAQIRELVRYLATVSDPHADKAFPAPNVISDVSLILRDAMTDLAEVYRVMSARTDQFADSLLLYTHKADDDDLPAGGAAHYVVQAATKLSNVAATIESLRADLDAAAEAGTLFNLRAGA